MSREKFCGNDSTICPVSNLFLSAFFLIVFFSNRTGSLQGSVVRGRFVWLIAELTCVNVQL